MLKIILSILIALLGWGMQRIIAWFNIKLKESNFAQKLDKAMSIVKTVVEKLYQTVVQKEKDTGVFTTQKQEQVLQMAVEQSKNHMDKSIKRFIHKEYQDIDSWLKTQIESTIYALKRVNN